MTDPNGRLTGSPPMTAPVDRRIAAAEGAGYRAVRPSLRQFDGERR